MRFDEALRHVLKHEGGYVNHPSDPGGETNQGITVAVARSFGYPGPMASIPPMVVRDIYLAHYWLPCRCDSLPPQIRLDVFDGAVNSGVSRSIKWLQAAVGADADVWRADRGALVRLGRAKSGRSRVSEVVGYCRAWHRWLRHRAKRGKNRARHCRSAEKMIYPAAEDAINKSLLMLPPRMDSKPARVMMIAIGLQESRLYHRRQIKGPARGLWQFEQGGGCRGVLEHHTTRKLAAEVCAARGTPATPEAVYAQLERDDVLAAAFARLLLYTDPMPLPATPIEAWGCYIRTWRPGKPHPETWHGFFNKAVTIVHGA